VGWGIADCLFRHILCVMNSVHLSGSCRMSFQLLAVKEGVQHSSDMLHPTCNENLQLYSLPSAHFMKIVVKLL
jgi:hypothetical protein